MSTMMPEVVLPGRLSCGKSHKGEIGGRLLLELDGRLVYRLQKYIEASIEESKQFLEIRELVVVYEDLRKAVHRAEYPNDTEELDTPQRHSAQHSGN